MKTPGFLGLALGAAMAVPVASLAAELVDVPRSETLIIDHAQTPQNAYENWNYLMPSSVLRAIGLHQFLMEPLFVLNLESGVIEPWLGESFTPNDTLDVWTLKIRDGAAWQDGEAFNADDVVYTINAMLEHAPALRDSGAIANMVDTVEKVDDLTVVFNLTQPNPRFQLDHFAVRVWGAVMIAPEHIFADQDPTAFTNYAEDGSLPVGTGPYKLVSTSPAEFIYDRDDNWWAAKIGFQDLPAPKRIIYMVNPTEQVRADLAVNDEIDIAWDMSLGTFQTIQAQNPNWITWQNDPIGPWPDPCHRGFNLNFAVEPWGDVEMRKAIDLGIDRQAINLYAFDGIAKTSRSMYPEYGGLLPIIDALDAKGMTFASKSDPEAARTIFESKGYEQGSDGIYAKDGEVLSIVFQVRDGSVDEIRMGEVLVEQLRKIGVDASLQRLNFSNLVTNRHNGEFEGIIIGVGCGSVSEPWYTMDQFSTRHLVPVGESASAAFGRWSGEDAERFSAIIAEVGVLPLGDAAIQAKVEEAYELWFDNRVAFPIVQAKFLLGFNTTYWDNWPTAENNYMQPGYWWHGWIKSVAKLKPAN